MALIRTALILHNPPVSDETLLHCSHCGRAVQPTLHTRDGWRVDHYLLYTGEVVPAVYKRDDEGRAADYLRLVSFELVVTCRDCYARGEIRAQRLFPKEQRDG